MVFAIFVVFVRGLRPKAQRSTIGQRLSRHDDGIEDERLIPGIYHDDPVWSRHDVEVLVVPVELVDATYVDAVDEHAGPPRLDIELHSTGGPILQRERRTNGWIMPVIASAFLASPRRR